MIGSKLACCVKSDVSRSFSYFSSLVQDFLRTALWESLCCCGNAFCVTNSGVVAYSERSTCYFVDSVVTKVKGNINRSLFKMVRELNMDTQRQNFWKESIHKEATVRLGWHMKYSKEFSRSSYVPKPRKEGMTLSMKSVPKADEVQLDAKKKATKQKFEDAAKKNPDALLVEMRPVSCGTRSLLYKGFSALGEGRYQYLQKRKLKRPEDKYEFPITSAWEIGWKIDEIMKDNLKPAQHGRTHEIQDSFYRRNGIFYTS